MRCSGSLGGYAGLLPLPAFFHQKTCKKTSRKMQRTQLLLEIRVFNFPKAAGRPDLDQNGFEPEN